MADDDVNAKETGQEPSEPVEQTPQRVRSEATKGNSGGGGDDGMPPWHPLIEGMFQSLPANGQPWTLDEVADWLHAAAYNLRFAYGLKGKITVEIKIEKPIQIKGENQDD